MQQARYVADLICKTVVKLITYLVPSLPVVSTKHLVPNCELSWLQNL